MLHPLMGCMGFHVGPVPSLADAGYAHYVAGWGNTATVVTPNSGINTAGPTIAM